MARGTGLALGEVRAGDILLVSGRSVFSRLVHVIEGTSFDHCLLVAPPNFEDPKFGRGANDDRTNELWCLDIGFFGGRYRPLSAYDDEVQAMAVRRHRLPITQQSIDRAMAFANRSSGYSWDRLLFLSLVSATRWSSSLSDLGPERSSALVRALYEVVAQMTRSTRTDGVRNICTDLLLDSFDVLVEIGSDFPAHAGLVFGRNEHEGLLWWASGMRTFEEFIWSQPPPKRRGILDEELALEPSSESALRLVHEMANQASNASFPGANPCDDETLRKIVIDGVSRTLDQLVGQLWRGDVSAARDPRKLAWFMLDTLMKHRIVVTPADIARTPTLVDVGLLHTEQVPWRTT